MKRKMYLQPETELLVIAQDSNYCATNLSTPASDGIEDWIVDEEGLWS